jgi:hypothetical protein
MGCSVQRPLRFQWVLVDNDPDWPNIPTRAKLAAHRMVRLSWLAVLLVIDYPALYRDYRRRFGVSMHTFRRDKRKARRNARYIWALLHGDYRTCMYLESRSLAE